MRTAPATSTWGRRSTWAARSARRRCNRVPAGLTLSQAVLDRLLRGDSQFGAPALETLQLSARDSFNFYGTATLDTYDAVTGKSLLNNLMLSTPAIYGSGGANDVATIHTANLIWQGAEAAPGTVVAGGAGTGGGRLDINAERIEFGYGEFAQASTTATLNRLALGFANVNLKASDRITANHKGSLSVYQNQGAYDPVKGFAYSGGNLNILTPLMTGAAGSVNKITAGGAIDISASAGPVGKVEGLGGELSLQGDAFAWPARWYCRRQGDPGRPCDLVLTDKASIDVSGRTSCSRPEQISAGGEVLLESRAGNVLQGSGSTIDLRPNTTSGQAARRGGGRRGRHRRPGGKILAAAAATRSGGTLVPYLAGAVEVRSSTWAARHLSDQFAALNQASTRASVWHAQLPTETGRPGHRQWCQSNTVMFRGQRRCA